MDTNGDTTQKITLLTPKDIESIFKCGRKKAYEIMNQKSFPSFRINNTLYVEQGELMKWIANSKGKIIIT